MLIPVLALLAVGQTFVERPLRTETSTSVAAPGAELARDMLHELNAGELQRRDARIRFLSLSLGERDAFLAEWTRISRPTGNALDVYTDLRSKRTARASMMPKAGFRDEYAKRSYDVLAAHQANERLLTIMTEQKSATGAWALSFFVGFGAGNFYTESYVMGVSMLLLQSISLAVAGATAGEYDHTPATVALALNRGLWLVDWISAIGTASSYNRALMESASATRAAPPSLFAFDF